MRVAICCSGPARDRVPTDAMTRAIVGADLVIAADGGATLAVMTGRQPDLVIGDMDSLSAEALAGLASAGVPLCTVPAAKDETDAELALAEAISRGAREIVLVGALGGRLDHSLGNLGLLAAAADGGARAWAMDIRLEVHYLRADGPAMTLAIEHRLGALLSLVPFGCKEATVSVAGVRWPLQDDRLLFARTRGISNEVLADRASVAVHDGALLVVLTDRQD